jgi:hypothetical protein
VRQRGGGPDFHGLSRAFLITTAGSLMTAGFLTITFSDNNDLGWRAALPAILLLTVFSAIGLSRWFTTRLVAAAAVLTLLLLSLPKSFQWAREYVEGMPTSSSLAFAKTPRLWQAVRAHTGPTERIAINPFFMAQMTPWSVNISWALLANRRSCFAGNDYVGPFTTLSAEQQKEVGARFARVFGGEASVNDLRILSSIDRCDVIVLTPGDGAWARNSFATSDLYKAVEIADNWRIYRRTTPAAR